MVDVDGVLHEQLPVGAHGIVVGARQDGIPAFILIEDQVEIVARTCEIVFEARGIAGETDEKPAAITLHSRRIKAELVHLEAGPVGILEGNAVQPALVVVGPVVVETQEIPGVAAGVAAHGGAAVAAGVVKDADLAVIATHDDERPSADAAGQEISSLWHLALVSRVEPRPVEDPPLLPLEQLRIRIDSRAETKDPLGGVVLKKAVWRNGDVLVHGLLPCELGRRSDKQGDTPGPTRDKILNVMCAALRLL